MYFILEYLKKKHWIFVKRYFYIHAIKIQYCVTDRIRTNNTIEIRKWTFGEYLLHTFLLEIAERWARLRNLKKIFALF